MTNQEKLIKNYTNSGIVEVSTKDEADLVLNIMHDHISRYGMISVGSLLEIVGFTPRETDYSYGWTSIGSAQNLRMNDGSYQIKLPKAVPLNNCAPTDEEKVDHPSNYQSENGIEVIDVIDAFTSELSGVMAFDIGNAIKYLCRWNNKGGVEDLKKAVWYIQHAIEHEEGRKHE